MMTTLTREHVEHYAAAAQQYGKNGPLGPLALIDAEHLAALCDLALRGLDTEHRPLAMDDVMREVSRATAKFPTWPTDPLHAVAVVGEEFGELTKAALQEVYEPHKNDRGDVRKEAVQTAAMAIRFIMSLDRYEYTPLAQHEQSPLSALPEPKP